MARIPPHIIDEIMDTARIEDVIGDFVSLKKAGSSLKGMSPFTDEKTPSFIVSPAKQIFKCFSTSKGGNVVTFIMEHEHFSYPEALKWLADRYNIEIPADKPLTLEEQAQLTERESLHIVNDFAKDFFADKMLNSDEGKAIGLSYFVERGFREDIVEKFQLGYCPQHEKSFTDTALEKGFQMKYLEQVGLTKQKDGRHFDFFRGRVMFPIHSVSGKTLGFGGRTLKSDKNVAKYFNSPESIIYNKSEILYGLYFSKSTISKYDNCFLVEGYTDVISMHQAGVENVVASSGTSLTKGQIKLIKRYTNNITILYDGDAAGIKASFRGIDLILEEGLNVQVVLFPDGDDPDSYAKKVSSTELVQYIDNNKKDFVSFKTDLLLDEGGNDPIQKAKLIKDIVASVALIPDSITRQVYVKNTAQRFDIPEQTLLIELNKVRNDVKERHLKEEKRKAIQASRQANNLAQNTASTSQHFKAQTPKTSNTSAADLPPDDFFAPHEDEMPAEAMLDAPNTNLGGVAENTYIAQETDLIRIMLQFGVRAIETVHKNELGKDEKIETSVIELIVYEIEHDELSFENKTLAAIYAVFKEGVEQDILYGQQSFLKHENQEIVQAVSKIITDKYELSGQWLSKHNIDINSELHKLDQAVFGALYSFKMAKINHRVDEIRNLLNPEHPNYNEENVMDLFAEQIALERVRVEFAKKLGRTIL